MAASPFFSGRISQDLFDHIERRIKETGETKTEILTQALATYTGFDLPDIKEGQQSPLMQKVELLSLEVKTIRERIKEIESFQNQQKQAPSKMEETATRIKEKLQETEISRQTTNSLPLFPDNSSDNASDNQESANVQILNTKQATKLLGIGSNSTIPVWYRDGKLPKMIDGKKLEFDHKEKEKGFFWKITTNKV